jgi:hypothetical protein
MNAPSSPSPPSAPQPLASVREFCRSALASLGLALGSLPFLAPGKAFYETDWEWVCHWAFVAMGIVALAAVIFGLRALIITHRAKGAWRGSLLAWFGLGVGVLSLILSAAHVFAPPRYDSRGRFRAWRNACINNLRQLDGAKEQWALEHKKTAEDIPIDSDLFGTDKYIKVKLRCPFNDGVYTLNAIKNKPTCSIAGHSLP